MRRKAHPKRTPPAADPARAGAASAADSDDWTVDALDRIDALIEKVRSNSTDRLVRIARMVVFGLLIAIMGVVVVVLATIALVRALDELIPGRVWLVYLLLGAILTAGAGFLWSQKTPKPQH